VKYMVDKFRIKIVFSTSVVLDTLKYGHMSISQSVVCTNALDKYHIYTFIYAMEYPPLIFFF